MLLPKRPVAPVTRYFIAVLAFRFSALALRF
jgi:hypothetical protein